MAVQLGQAFVALHFDGKALPAEAEEQVGAALAAASEAGAAAMESLGAEGAAAGAEIGAAADEAAAAIGRIDAAAAGADGALAGMGTAARTAGAEAAAAGDATAASAERVAGASERAAKSTGLLGLSWKQVGEFAGAAAIYEAIKSAGNYQSQLTRLATTAGESYSNLGRVGDGMLKLGDQVGYSGNELAKAMYIVESSMPPAETGAKRAADALLILKASSEGAKQEGADLGHVVDAVTTSLHDYHLPASDAAKVTSELITAVSHGKVTFDELTGAMHSVEPRAAAAGMSIAQTSGALAAMTASGMSAQQAADNLGHTLQNFERPTQPMINAMANVGLNALQVRDNLGKTGIAGAMQELSDAIISKMDPATRQVLIPALNQNRVALGALSSMISAMPPDLAKLSQSLLDGSTSWGAYRKATQGLGGRAGSEATQFLSLYKSTDGFNSSLKGGGPAIQTYLGQLGQMVGTSDALNVALQLTGENTKYVNGTIDDVARASAQADGNIKGWSEVQATFNQRFAEAKAAVENFGISVGEKLLPGLGKAFTWIAQQGVPALENLEHWLGEVANSAPVQAAWTALIGTGKALLPVLQLGASLLGTIGHAFSALPKPVQDVIALLLILKAVTAFDLFGRMAGSSTALVAGIGRAGSAVTGFRTTYSQAMNGAATDTARVGTAIEDLSTQGSAALDRLAEAYGVVDEAETTTMTRTEALGTAFSTAMPRISGLVAATATSVQESFARIQLSAAEAQAAVMNAEADMSLEGMFAAAGPNIGATTGKLAGFTAGAKAAAGEVGGALKGALGGVTSMLGGPFGVALIAGMVGFSLIQNAIQARDEAVQKATSDMKGYFDEIAQGGGQAGADIQKVSAQQQELAASTAKLNQLKAAQAGIEQQAGRGAAGYAAAINEQQQKVDDLNKEYHNSWDTLGPLEQAQVKLSTAVHDYGINSDQAKAAAQAYQGVLVQQKAETDLLNGAELTHIQRLEQTGQKQLDAVNASLAAQQAQLSFKQQLDQLNQGMKDGSLTGDALAAAQLQIAQTAIQTADATGQSAAAQAAANGVADTTHIANQATLDQLQALAAQFGGHVPAAISQQIAALQKSDGAQAVAKQMVDDLSKAIVSVPDGKTVVIHAPTDQQRTDLQNLGLTVTQIPGTKDVTVTANTADARAALQAFVNTQWFVGITGVVHVSYTGTGITANGGVGHFGSTGMAMGGILHAYDTGGFEPMMAGIPQVIGPRTYRIIGDRAATDEAYIPLDGSPRSRALWADAGRRMGLIGAGPAGGAAQPVQVTYAPQYALPPVADAAQVAAMVGANTARDFQLGITSLASLGLAT